MPDAVELEHIHMHTAEAISAVVYGTATPKIPLIISLYATTMDYPPTAIVSTFYKALTDQGTAWKVGSREADKQMKMREKEM